MRRLLTKLRSRLSRLRIVQPKVKCDFEGCEKPATTYVRWGLLEGQTCLVCAVHTKECWLAAKNQIEAGVCFWIQQPLQEAATRRRTMRRLLSTIWHWLREQVAFVRWLLGGDDDWRNGM